MKPRPALPACLVLALALAFFVSVSSSLAASPSAALDGAEGMVQAGLAEVPGGEIFYEVRGEGPALVLVHDGLIHREGWDPVWEELARDHRVVRYDRRGYGRSPAATEPYVPRDDLVALLDHLEIPAATLVAASAGSDLAVRFTIAYPARVERLVLVGPVVSGLGFSKHFGARNQGVMQATEGKDAPAAAAAWLEDPYLVAATSTAGRERFRELLSANPQNLNRPPRMERGRLAFGGLEQVRVPTLILVGERDHPDVHAHAGALQASIRGARREVIGGTGHLVYLEEPRAFLDALAPFLKEPVRSSTTLDLRTSPCVDLYFHVRSLAAADAGSEGERGSEAGTGGATEGGIEVEAAVAALKALQEDLGESLLSWGPFDRQVEGCTEISELPERLGRISGGIRLPGGTVEMGSRGRELGEALAAAEEAFLQTVWPAHRESLRAAEGQLRESLLAKLPEAMAYHLRSLGMHDPEAEIPVYLVNRIPWPGAVTQAQATQEGRDPGGVAFVGVSDLSGGLLTEIVLHEATHALDILTGESGNVFDELREGLDEAGLPFSDRRRRDIPHNLMFIQAGETIRRVMDGTHRHYGVVEGYYDRVPTARREVSIWVDHLDGDVPRWQAFEDLLALAEE